MRNLWMMVLVGFVVFAWAGCGKKETDEKSRAQAVEEKAAQARKKAEGERKSEPTEAKADEAKEGAKAESAEADEATEEAETEVAKADEATKEAETEVAKPEEATEEAETEVAKAEEATEEAKTEEGTAEEGTEEAETEEVKAEEGTEEAETEEVKAEEAKEEEKVEQPADSGAGFTPPPFENVEETKWDIRRRAQMVEYLKTDYRRKITDERVLDAMGAVPRHMYMLEKDRDDAYRQMWYRIGYGQTITDPGMVAWMTQLINVQPTDKVLEIGTGSGYQASVLAQLTPNVCSIEIVEKLAKRTHKLLQKLGYFDDIKTRIADGYYGWEEEAPFDKVIVTCAADHIPVPLIQQLKPGGLMVIPVGPRYQPGKLYFISKDADGKVHKKVLTTVHFVPMTRKKEK